MAGSGFNAPVACRTGPGLAGLCYDLPRDPHGGLPNDLIARCQLTDFRLDPTPSLLFLWPPLHSPLEADAPRRSNAR